MSYILTQKPKLRLCDSGGAASIRAGCAASFSTHAAILHFQTLAPEARSKCSADSAPSGRHSEQDKGDAYFKHVFPESGPNFLANATPKQVVTQCVPHALPNTAQSRLSRIAQ